jgi:uncharacterized membrane protein YhaH (DUF805 family)
MSTRTFQWMVMTCWSAILVAFVTLVISQRISTSGARWVVVVFLIGLATVLKIIGNGTAAAPVSRLLHDKF